MPIYQAQRHAMPGLQSLTLKEKGSSPSFEPRLQAPLRQLCRLTYRLVIFLASGELTTSANIAIAAQYFICFHRALLLTGRSAPDSHLYTPTLVCASYSLGDLASIHLNPTLLQNYHKTATASRSSRLSNTPSRFTLLASLTATRITTSSPEQGRHGAFRCCSFSTRRGCPSSTFGHS